MYIEEQTIRNTQQQQNTQIIIEKKKIQEKLTRVCVTTAKRKVISDDAKEIQFTISTANADRAARVVLPCIFI